MRLTTSSFRLDVVPDIRGSTGVAFLSFVHCAISAMQDVRSCDPAAHRLALRTRRFMFPEVIFIVPAGDAIRYCNALRS